MDIKPGIGEYDEELGYPKQPDNAAKHDTVELVPVDSYENISSGEQVSLKLWSLTSIVIYRGLPTRLHSQSLWDPQSTVDAYRGYELPVHVS